MGWHGDAGSSRAPPSPHAAASLARIYGLSFFVEREQYVTLKRMYSTWQERRSRSSSKRTFAMLPPEQCPAHPGARRALEWMGREFEGAIAPELIEHRDRVLAKHFKLPLVL